MWNVKPGIDNSRGGFQNADLGKTQFDKNYGPDFGVDYARFSDLPDVKKDFRLQTYIEKELSNHEDFREVSPSVRNGFVILKGHTQNQIIQHDVIEFVKNISGVIEVINQIAIQQEGDL